jgi:hypothetical protein
MLFYYLKVTVLSGPLEVKADKYTATFFPKKRMDKKGRKL